MKQTKNERLMKTQHKFIVASDVEPNDWGEMCVDLNITFNITQLKQDGCSDLYDRIFDHVNAAIKEATVLQGIEDAE
jgi:hypothetical protein